MDIATASAWAAVIMLFYPVGSFTIKRVRRWRKAVAARTRAEQMAMVRRERLPGKSLDLLYPPESLRANGLSLYQFGIETRPHHTETITTGLAFSPSWAFPVQLHGSHIKYQLTNVHPELDEEQTRKHEQCARALQRQGVKIWDSPMYSLVGLEFDNAGVRMSFALDSFYNYRFTIGLLPDELYEVLCRPHGFASIVYHRWERLPLREKYLPDAKALVDLEGRLCVGGIVVVFAVATPDNDFIIPIQTRSNRVAVEQGVRTVIPQAFHQPVKGSQRTVDLAYAVYRELYEELMGGEEVEENPRNVDPFFFYKTCEPIRWLRDPTNSGACHLEMTFLGINCMSGNYEICILLAVTSEQFWGSHGAKLSYNWEAANLELLSTQDAGRLAAAITKPDWSSGGLVALTRGLQRLEEISPDRVALPHITICRS